MDEMLSVIESKLQRAKAFFGPADGIGFEVNADSLQAVESDVERRRGEPGWDPDSDEADELVWLVGAFLGACIIDVTRGKWHVDDRGVPGVRLPNGVVAFPFGKARKALHSGVDGGESLVGFYRVVVEGFAAAENVAVPKSRLRRPGLLTKWTPPRGRN
ncbi:hypothetical protein V7968_31890 [Nocardia vulneris]|uniref:hypothetical protein n=1 Tax=Nocardia vulneris TaxID=1141657 RepID=UPI0030CE195C